MDSPFRIGVLRRCLTRKKPWKILGEAVDCNRSSSLIFFIFKHYPENHYEVLSNEAGLHLSKKNNLATDIGIYKIEALPPGSITNKYFEIAPFVAIEMRY